MRNLLAFLAAVTLTLAGVGWYLGWYTIQSQPSASGKSTISIEFDDGKIGSDLKKGLQSVEQKLQKNSDSTPKDSAAETTPTDKKSDDGKKTTDATPPKATLGLPPRLQ